MKHQTIYRDSSQIAIELPLIPELKQYHTNGSFPLVENPLDTGRTIIIGMFVLRPAKQGVKGPVKGPADMEQFYAADGWAYNVAGRDGGALIANRNSVDAFRLALQYALADAVIVGSRTVAVEGVDHDGKQGYVWFPHTPAGWDQVRKHDAWFLDKLFKNRQLWQEKGYLSKRKFPAQIVVSQSGKPSEPYDYLDARIFHDRDPDGNPIEAYILTSIDGAERIRNRAHRFGLEKRIEDILIPVSPEGDPQLIDLAQVPELLHDKYDIRIANHDGGRRVLSEFLKAGILPQINLTLSRGHSIVDLLVEQGDDTILDDFDTRVSYFFGTSTIPRALVPISMIVDDKEEVAVVTFDSRGLTGKGL